MTHSFPTRRSSDLGKVTIDSFTDERRFRPDMERLLDRIRLVQTDAIPGHFEAMHVEIAVRLADGQQLAARCDKPRGAWGTPPLKPEEHLTKVQDCLQRRFDAARIADRKSTRLNSSH